MTQTGISRIRCGAKGGGGATRVPDHGLGRLADSNVNLVVQVAKRQQGNDSDHGALVIGTEYDVIGVLVQI